MKDVSWTVARVIANHFDIELPESRPVEQLPEGSMRVAPNTDAVVWRICPDYKAEL